MDNKYLEAADSDNKAQGCSPESLIESTLKNHDALTESKGEEKTHNELKSQIKGLITLLISSKSQLDKLRFTMADRVTSAVTKMALLKATGMASDSKIEELWLNQGLNDLTHLSSVIEEWTRLYEIIDINQLEDPTEIQKMITTISNLNPLTESSTTSFP